MIANLGLSFVVLAALDHLNEEPHGGPFRCKADRPPNGFGEPAIDREFEGTSPEIRRRRQRAKIGGMTSST